MENKVINIVQEIQESEASIKTFLKEALQKIVDAGLLNEVLMAHIHPLMLEERLPIVQEKIASILEN